MLMYLVDYLVDLLQARGYLLLIALQDRLFYDFLDE